MWADDLTHAEVLNLARLVNRALDAEMNGDMGTFYRVLYVLSVRYGYSWYWYDESA